MTAELAIVGCGNVGAELLRQVAGQAERLLVYGIDLRVVALTNSRRMLVDPAGLELGAWRGELASRGLPLRLETLEALGPGLKNPALIDCTAGDGVPLAYPEFLAAGFNVVTPNKRGNTGSMDRYRALRRLAQRSRRRYLYEATVGAGLPVIDTLRNLVLAGDELRRFSGVLSGSLSFLFGRLEEGAPFSAVVREAMARGFTEPDPRDDLSGLDVARKVLILAREAGSSLELADVELEGLLPPSYLTMDKEEFLARMPELDASFESRRSAAAASGEVLRFVGSIEGGACRAGLRSVGPEHPLYAVKGGENALAFHTRYYDPVPLLLRGYGAGATVTAAGIFADILRTLSWDAR